MCLCYAAGVLQMGTEKESFIELTERIGRKTGGVSVYPFTSPKRGEEQPIAKLMVSALVTHCLSSPEIPLP